MRVTTLVLTVPLLFSSSFGPLKGEEKPNTMIVKKITANLYAEEVGPCVRFWVERLGFEKIMEVLDGQKLAFAMLKKGNLELMYGSYASLDKDVDSAKSYQRGTTFLYVEVGKLDDVVSAMKGADVVKPVHTTPYGAKEISVKDPAGHIITFAQPAVEPQH